MIKVDFERERRIGALCVNLAKEDDKEEEVEDEEIGFVSVKNAEQGT